MEYCLKPWVSWSFLQNNYHQAVKKMESPDDCCFAKNSMKPRVADNIP